jgi:selenium metabolism protein YedF
MTNNSLLIALWSQTAYSQSLNPKRCILLPAALVLEIKEKRKGDEKMVETRQAVLAGEACCAGENPVQAEPAPDAKKILVILAADCVGKGDDELGRKIMINFIRTMKEMGGDLWRLVLLNAGVKLAVEGSEVLPQLQALAGAGVGILVCGPCLKVFNLFEKKQVGEITNMLDIVTSMQMADKVISLT